MTESTPAAIIDEIHNERIRQIFEEGYSAEHDDAHRYGEMAVQAAFLAVDDTHAYVDDNTPTNSGPGGGESWGLAKKHRGNRRRQLVVAAALLVAEIQRLERLEP